MVEDRTPLRGWVRCVAVCGLVAVGCGGGGGPDLTRTATDPLDQEVASLALVQGMDGDPTDGRSFPAPEEPLPQLGMRLFFSKSLGKDRDAACVTCHHPLLGGGDGLSLPIGVGAVDPDRLGPGRVHSASAAGFDGGPTVPRNAPSTFNVGLRPEVLFFDGRVESLVQPTGGMPALIRTPDSAFGTIDPLAGDDLVMALSRFPVTSPVEMKGHAAGALDNQQLREYLAGRLGGFGAGASDLADTGYWLQQFRAGFQDPTGSAASLITEQNVARALGAYQRSQVLVDTPWRRYLAGDTGAISAQAKRGARHFLTDRGAGGKGCVACHGGDLFARDIFTNIAMPQLGRSPGDGPAGTEDFGREHASGDAADRYAFRVPSLLNVAVTGPWGHSGAYTSLRAMVAHYRRPTEAARRYDRGQLSQPGIQNLFTIPANTQGAVDKLVADRAAGRRVLPDTPMTDQEVDEIVAFLETLTDPCTQDPGCMARWIPDPVVGADPNGDQLLAVISR